MSVVLVAGVEEAHPVLVYREQQTQEVGVVVAHYPQLIRVAAVALVLSLFATLALPALQVEPSHLLAGTPTIPLQAQEPLRQTKELTWHILQKFQEALWCK